MARWSQCSKCCNKLSCVSEFVLLKACSRNHNPKEVFYSIEMAQVQGMELIDT